MEEGLTVRQCVKRLNAGPWATRSGRQQWAPSVVHHVLSDPVYTGTAYANRFEYVVPKKARGRSPRSGERTSRRPRPPEQWIAIPVPALIVNGGAILERPAERVSLTDVTGDLPAAVPRISVIQAGSWSGMACWR